MLQHAPATARLCARRTFLRIWQVPFASRPALIAEILGPHPITREANTFYSQQRLFSTNTRQLSTPETALNMPAHQQPFVKLESPSSIKLEDEEKHFNVDGKTLSPSMSEIPHFDATQESQTIYALSTGAGRAAIAIIRISGPVCIQVYHALCPGRRLPRERYASVRTLHHPTDRKNILDSDAMVLLFRAPNTATGEDMLELHVHGGPATVKAIMTAIPEVDPKAIRAAAPGEFTRRAFTNDKLDLGQIESLGDTLSAETEFQRRAALRGRSGELSRIYESWRESLIEELAHAAADTDHSEEHSLDDMAGIWPRIISKATKMCNEMQRHQLGATRGQLLRKGIQVSLIGLPNAGKSSLFNQIVGRETSIVNQQAGTTRDVVEATVDYNGYLCTFSDTAGIRAKDVVKEADIGAIEQEGIKRAKAKAKDADVVVYVTTFEPDSRNSCGYSVPIMEDLISIIQKPDGRFKPLLIVVNKSDRPKPSQRQHAIETFTRAIDQLIPRTVPASIVDISVIDAKAGRDKEGNIRGFGRALICLFKNLTEMPIEFEHLIGVTERQSQLLKICTVHLRKFVEEAKRIAPPPDNSIATYHLEQAAKCLAEMTGRFEGAGDVEEILGVVFSKFCIGK